MKTKAGEMFDWLAYRELGSEKYLPELMNANKDSQRVYIFSAGVELTLPEVQKKARRLPPWKK